MLFRSLHLAGLGLGQALRQAKAVVWQLLGGGLGLAGLLMLVRI